MPQTPIKHRVSQHLVVGLIYLGLAILLTWPTVVHLSSHLPGDGGDDPAIAWNLWWVKHALLVEGQNPLHTDTMFYPIGLNLAYYTLTVLNAVTALPLTLNLGLVTASNLHMLFTFVAGGYGAFLLVNYQLSISQSPTRSVPISNYQLPLIPTLAGLFYAFASSKLFYIALGQFNIGSNHWIPFAVLYVLRMHHRPDRLKNVFMAGLFLTLQAWAELTYASFILIFIGLYWLYWLTLIVIYRLSLPPRSPAPLPPCFASPASFHLRAALLLGLTFALGLSPILAQIIPDMLTEGDFLVEGEGFATPFSADLLGFLIPTMHQPLFGHLVTLTHISDYTLGQHIYLGFVLLGLVAVPFRAIYRQPAMRFWLFAAIVFALLCLGPTITVNGHNTGLPGPFALLQQLPFFKGNRYPSRYSVMLLLSLSVLAGFSLGQLNHWLARSRRVRPAWLFSLIGLLFLFEHLATPLPQSDMRIPPAYTPIAADPDTFTVLDIPFAWRNGFSVIGAQTTQFMFGQFYQTAHQKPLLQGNTSRNPEFKFQYFVNAPVINSLLALETGQSLPPERWTADRAIAAEVLHFFDIKYIVVRPYHYDRWDGVQNVTVTEQPVIPYIEALFPVEKIFDQNGTMVYQVQALLPSTNRREFGGESLIDTGSPLAPLYFGEGWGLFSQGQPLTAQRRRVRLLLPLAEGPQRVTLQLRLPEAFDGTSQTVRLELKGWQSPPQPVSREWGEVAFEVPAGVAQAGQNDVWLHFETVTDLPALAPGTQPLDITVLSAGTDVGGAGGLGHIFVNGHDVSPNERGYNAVQLATDGSLQIANFDTHLDPAASAALAEFVRHASSEGLLALTATDEASQNLSEAAVQALQSLGASGDLRGCFRCSHALIRRADGPILEGIDSLRPVGLTTGLGLTEPRVAAQVGWVRVEPVEP